MGLRYKGFTAVQSAVNHHVIIFLGDKFATEIQCLKKLSQDGLKELIELHLSLESKAKARSANNIFYGQKIRKMRCEKRIRLIDMAEKLNCKLTHYCDLECGYVTASEKEKKEIERVMKQ